MDDGWRVDVASDSAAAAQYEALRRHLGHRVSRCWLGRSGKQAHENEGIEFEVVTHDPRTERGGKERKDRHPLCTMFDDATILAESARARA